MCDPDRARPDPPPLGRSLSSVNTGKYTLVPYLGLKAAERVVGLKTNDFGLA